MQHKRTKMNYSFVDPKLFDTPIDKFVHKERHLAAMSSLDIFSVGDFVCQALPLLARGKVRGMAHNTIGGIAEDVMKHTGIDQISLQQWRDNFHPKSEINDYLNETRTRLTNEIMSALAEGEFEKV